MVIEDNSDLLDIYQDRLKKAGFEVACAANGEEALQKFLHFRPRIILCDIKMPHLSGFDVVEILNSYPKLKSQTTIFILSAYSDKKMLKRAEQLGISRKHYLVKSQTTLNEALAKIQAAA